MEALTMNLSKTTAKGKPGLLYKESATNLDRYISKLALVESSYKLCEI